MENATSPIADQNNKPKSKLRWYQFSLRTLLICITLVAVFCSWFTVKKQQADRQKAAVEVLESHGYHITYDYEHYSTAPGYDKPTPAPDWFVNLVGRDFLYDVYSVGESVSLPLFKTHVPALTDADMAVFEQLPKLRTIRFCNLYGNPAKITNQGIVHLKKLKYLESVVLWNTLVTDDGVRDLQNEIPNLKISHGNLSGRFAYPFEWSEEESIHVTTSVNVP